MLNRIFDFLHIQPAWKKLVAFFSGLGIIASAVLAIIELMNPSVDIDKNQLADSNNTSINGKNNQSNINNGDQGSAGNRNNNTWNNQKKNMIILQGNQNSIGDRNQNNWYNSNGGNRNDSSKDD